MPEAVVRNVSAATSHDVHHFSALCSHSSGGDIAWPDSDMHAQCASARCHDCEESVAGISGLLLCRGKLYLSNISH